MAWRYPIGSPAVMRLRGQVRHYSEHDLPITRYESGSNKSELANSALLSRRKRHGAVTLLFRIHFGQLSSGPLVLNRGIALEVQFRESSFRTRHRDLAENTRVSP